MYLQQLKNIMVLRRLNKADISRMAGVSRAAVTKWFGSEKGVCNVETFTLMKLAAALKLSPEYFLKECEDLQSFETLFLWDHLYSSMEEFIVTLTRDRLSSIARLVQVMGFHSAVKIIGQRAVDLFPKYKQFIKPARQRELEILWPLYRTH